MIRFSLFASVLISLSTLSLAEAPRPNIIFILSDDQGVGDVQALWAEGKIATPHIDALAAEGVTFTDGHTTSGVCTPTRYSVLTGRYNWRSPLQRSVTRGYSPALIETGRQTVGKALQDAGYHTACIGKWHIGMDIFLKDGTRADDRETGGKPYTQAWEVDYERSIENGPVDRGFDHFYGITASLDMPPYVWVNDRNFTGIPSETKAFHRPGPALADFEDIDVLPEITERAVAYIGERAAEAKASSEKRTPFFLYFPLNAPHTPITPSKEWQGKSGLNGYGDFVMQVDWTVGQITEALEKNGLSENTLVIFTTDNGCSPAAKFDELKKLAHLPSGPLRGNKADIYEGGHRVPFIAKWPAIVPAGSQVDHLVSQVDFFATAAELAGGEVSPSAAEDSFSFASLLRDPKGKATRTKGIMHSINGSFCYRDGLWKLIVAPGSGGWSVPHAGAA